jgi:hypothetical protein
MGTLIDRTWTMLATATVLTCLVSGCESYRMYFHENSDGTRYYETKTGEVLRVTPAGVVYKGEQRLGKTSVLSTYADGFVVPDWDLRSYDVVPPSGHCSSMFQEEPQPVPCWTQIYEFPIMIVASPLAAVYNLMSGGMLTVPEGRKSDPSHMDHTDQ